MGFVFCFELNGRKVFVVYERKWAMPCYSEGILLITSELASEFSYRLPMISRKLGNEQAQMHDYKPVRSFMVIHGNFTSFALFSDSLAVFNLFILPLTQIREIIMFLV